MSTGLLWSVWAVSVQVTVRCRYTAVTFFHKYPQRTLHSSPGRARYGVSFVDSASV